MSNANFTESVATFSPGRATLPKESTPAASEEMPLTSGSVIGLLDRFRSHWVLKSILLVGLLLLFCVPYLYLGHRAFVPVHRLPVLPPDRWAGFDPRWVWVYQSIYLITCTLPGLATRRTELLRFCAGFALLAACCLLIYTLFPTRIPRPVSDAPVGMYGLLLFYDGPYNACPSLHAGFLYYTLAFARRIYGRAPLWVSVGLIGWSLLILWATLATKEHGFIDLIVGIALAGMCDVVVWKRPGESKPRLMSQRREGAGCRTRQCTRHM